jgi:salicylate hydroxylase
LTIERNAYTGEVLSIVRHPENSDAHHRGAIRARRTRLQSALLAKVPEGIIQYSKKLILLENLPDHGVRLVFEDQTEVFADIVVGADGLHSVCQPPSKV